MRITQNTGLEFAAARLDAIPTAGAGEELVFQVPEEETEPAGRRTREARDERDRERETVREAPSVERIMEAAAWTMPAAAPPLPRQATEPPAAVDREVGKAPVAGDAPRERARSEGKAGTPATATAKSVEPVASETPGETRPGSERSTHGAGETKARTVDPLPALEGATPEPEGAPATAAARAPAEAVASAAAQAAVETVIVPAGVAAVAAPVAVAPKGSASDPAVPEARAKGAAPATTSLPTVAGALPAESQRQSDNGLTPVNGSAPAALAEGDNPLRARLQDALRSSINQRVLQQAASGELELPGLGRVAVSARAADSGVAVEVHAAQVATAQLLHASAGDIAADVLAAEIPLSTLTFAGAGTWSHSDGHAPPPEREAAPLGATTNEVNAGPSGRAIPAAPGRVRIVL